MHAMGWGGALLLAGAQLLGAAQAQGYYGGSDYAEIIRCESRDYRQVYCDADARRGIRIVNQLSDTACIEGRTWGWDRRGVWVSGGCRAEFEIGDGRGPDHYGGDYAKLIRCESRDYRQVYCDVDTRGGVRLVDQLSGAACIEGDTWGADRRGVWVRNGCRGEFELGAGGYGAYDRGDRGLPVERGRGYGQARSLVCESRDNRYRHCPAPVYREAELVRRLSDARCDFNRSWGYDANGVWVDRGCRGEFVVR